MTKVDARGRRRIAPRDAAQAYGIVREARPAWPMYQAALVAAALGYGVRNLSGDRFAKALDDTLAEVLKMVTQQQKVKASRDAARWESNPFLKDEMAMLFRKEMVRPALAEGKTWIKRVKRRGQRAEADKDWGNALRSDELLVKHVPMEGLLNGRDMAPPVPEQSNQAQVQINVILGDPTARRALEALARILEGESSGNGGQVVAGTVAPSEAPGISV